MTDINGPTDLKGRMVGAISGGMDGEIPAKAIEKEHGAFKSFKGYAGYAEMFADMEIGRIGGGARHRGRQLHQGQARRGASIISAPSSSDSPRSAK